MPLSLAPMPRRFLAPCPTWKITTLSPSLVAQFSPNRAFQSRRLKQSKTGAIGLFEIYWKSWIPCWISVSNVKRPVALCHFGSNQFVREVYTDIMFHHLTVLNEDGSENNSEAIVQDIGGPLCFQGTWWFEVHASSFFRWLYCQRGHFAKNEGKWLHRHAWYWWIHSCSLLKVKLYQMFV